MVTPERAVFTIERRESLVMDVHANFIGARRIRVSVVHDAPAHAIAMACKKQPFTLRLCLREMALELCEGRRGRHWVSLRTVTGTNKAVIAAAKTEAFGHKCRRILGILLPFELSLENLQVIHESSFWRSAAEVDSVPRGISGPIISASLRFSNHAKKEDCSAPGSLCWFNQL